MNQMFNAIHNLNLQHIQTTQTKIGIYCPFFAIICFVAKYRIIDIKIIDYYLQLFRQINELNMTHC